VDEDAGALITYGGEMSDGSVITGFSRVGRLRGGSDSILPDCALHVEIEYIRKKRAEMLRLSFTAWFLSTINICCMDGKEKPEEIMP
jgi:hypothetical protein